MLDEDSVKRFEANRDVAFHLKLIANRRREPCPHCWCGAGLRKTATGESLECCWCDRVIYATTKEMEAEPL